VAIGGDLRVLLGALMGVGAGGLLILTALPALVPVERAHPVPATPPAPVVMVEPEEGAPAEAAVAPRFDTVRVAPDGSGLVAGQAVPGATVAVLAGEEVAAEATADGDGRFVAFLDLPPSAEPRALSLRDQAGTVSEETVIVAPTGGQVAEAAGGVASDGVPAGDADSAELQGEVPDSTESGDATPGATVVAEAEGQASTPDAPVTEMRDLPSDQPTPTIAPTGDAGPSPLGTGEAPLASGPAGTEGEAPEAAPEAEAEVASAEPGMSTPATATPSEAAGGPEGASGTAPATLAEGGIAAEQTESESAAPEVTSLAPSEAEVRSDDGGAPETSASLQDGPYSIAVAVAGPSAASPDLPPQRGSAPEVSDVPGGLPASEEDTPGQAAVLLSDAEGVRVLQPALAPGADAEILSTVALDAISYGGEGEVLLSGRASGGGGVRLYLDNAPVADVPVGADGEWSTTLTGTEPGDYTLRVDQVDAAGEVVSRIETPFRREARSDLAAAMSEAQRPGQTIAVRTVQPGNTLWAISRDRYGQGIMYVQVWEMNRDRIRDPDLIYPGQVFVLPATEGR
jgi:nucleoid-associated protein YgaU